MYTNYTYDDFIKTDDKLVFIQKVIMDFKSSSFYTDADIAKTYYKGENNAIMNRIRQFVGQNKCLVEDITKANNTIPNGFYTKIVKQANGYLLANGVNLEKEIKDSLGKKLDIKLQRAGLNAQIQGVSWGYCFIDVNGFNIDTWKGQEFIPLYDERTGKLRAGIRFWQIATNKSIMVTMYEEDGYSEYEIDSKTNKTAMTKDKQPYIIIRKKDALEESVIGENNWSTLPIVPLFANDSKETTLTNTIKNLIDLYDIVESDFGNNLEDSQDVYWVIKNYNGQDLGTFLEDYKYYKSIKVSGDGDAKAQTIEVPWQARKEALQIIKTNIYDFAMAVDMSTIRGGSQATTTEIDAAFYDLDMKTNEFENNVVDFMEGIIELWQEYTNNNMDYNVAFTRDKLVNKKEALEMVYIAREDLDRETTLEIILPYLGLDISKVPDILDKIDTEAMNKVEVPVDTQNDNDMDNNIV